MNEIHHDLLIKLINKDLEEFLHIAFIPDPVNLSVFDKEFDSNIIVELSNKDYSGLIILHFDFQFLNQIYHNSTGTYYNPESATKDFGKEMINMVGAKFIDVIQITNLHLGVPKFIESNNFQLDDLSREFFVYVFHYQNQKLKFYLSLQKSLS